MPPGKCYNCHQPGHWANNCPLKTTDAVTVTSPPVIHCPCNAGVCKVLTSKTVKNPNRRFYICPSVTSCGFFKWCNEVNIIKPEPILDHSTCPKKSFGFKDEAHILTESEEVGHGCSPLIRFSGFDSVDDEDIVEETELDSDGNVKRTRLGVVVVDTLPVNVGKESIPVCSSFNNRKPVSKGGFASINGNLPSFVLITEYKDVDGFETTEQVLPSLEHKHLEPQVEALCGDLFEFNGKACYASEDITALSLNTKNPGANNTIKLEHQSTSEASFSGSSFLMVDLIAQYNMAKLHFESVSKKHVEALIAFTSSYKQLESLRSRADSLRKELLEGERQVKLYEASSSEFAASLQEVSDEMAKSQKRMAEMAGRVAKQVKVYKQSDFAAL